MADIFLDTEANPTTPGSNQGVAFFNSTNKLLTTINDAGTVNTFGSGTLFTAGNTTDQTGFSSDTLLGGSAITVPPGGLRVGSVYKLKFDMTKTGAGTATPTLTIRYGTTGTTSDSARLAFTFAAGTAAIDSGTFDLQIAVRTAGASGVMNGWCGCSHMLAATGLISTGASGFGIIFVNSSAFDLTVAGSIISASFNGGASFAGTLTSCAAELRAC